MKKLLQAARDVVGYWDLLDSKDTEDPRYAEEYAPQMDEKMEILRQAIEEEEKRNA